MKLYDFFETCQDKNIICLGRFDGLHIGHKTLIYHATRMRNELNDGTKLAVFMFQGNEAIGRSTHIFTFKESVELFKEEPVDNLIVAAETEKFYSIDRDTFLRILVANFNPKCIVCGEDYTFGYNRQGDVEYLKKYCSIHNIKLEVLPIIKQGDEKISTSKIKEYLKNGQVGKAGCMLGGNYFVYSRVIKGRGVGHQIGFPTLNMWISSEKAPLKEGVYATFTHIGNTISRSITHYGSAPTFGSSVKLCETHVISRSVDLYGLDVRVDFKKFLRETIKFNSVDELIYRIQEDIKRI